MNAMNGLLLVDKPAGCSSHDVVAKARRILGLRSIGHAGTLDPLATGLLILLLGEATKVSDYVLNGDKAYEVTVRLGLRTDSFDIDGQVVSESDVHVTNDQVASEVAKLQGTLLLHVPIFSAVKVNGKKLYEYARAEKEVAVPAREMDFKSVEFLSFEDGCVRARLSCSKGSFIRSWASQLGENLGCGGTVQALRRVESVPYRVETALTLDELEFRWRNREQRTAAVLGDAWVPLKSTLPHFRSVKILGQDEIMMRNGQISRKLQTELLRFVTVGEAIPGVKVISGETEDLVSLLLHEPGKFYRIKRVFHPTEF